MSTATPLVRWWPWLRLVAGLAILGALVWRMGTGAFVDGLRVITVGPVLAALGIGLLTTVLSAWRWCLIARGLGLALSLPAAIADYYRSLLLNAVLPAGVLGDVHRAVNHGRRSGDVGNCVRAVVLERFAGQAVLLVLGAAVLLAQPSFLGMVLPGRTALVLPAVVLVVAAVVVVRTRAALGTTLARARELLPVAPKAALLSAAAIAGHVTLFVIAARTAGVSAPVLTLMPLMLLALVVMSLPLNVGGWGPREGFTALAFGTTGLGATAGLTTAVVYGVLALVASLPGAVTLFRGTRRTSAPTTRAEPVPCVPRPAKAARPHRTRYTRPGLGRGGAGDRPRSNPPSHSRA